MNTCVYIYDKIYKSDNKWRYELFYFIFMFCLSCIGLHNVSDSHRGIYAQTVELSMPYIESFDYI